MGTNGEQEPTPGLSVWQSPAINTYNKHLPTIINTYSRAVKTISALETPITTRYHLSALSQEQALQKKKVLLNTRKYHHANQNIHLKIQSQAGICVAKLTL